MIERYGALSASRAFRLETALGDMPEPARELARHLDPVQQADWVADRAMELTFPERLSDTRFHEAVFQSSLDNIDMMWRIIAGRSRLDAAPPIGALTFADVCAEVGVPVSQIERVYRLGIALVWVSWYREARTFAGTSGLELGPLIEVPTLVIHSYIDGMVTPVTERYDATRAQARRTRDQLRRSILSAALSGAQVLAEQESAEALGVAADGQFLAFAARGERINHHDLAEHARRAANAKVVLPYRHATDTWVIWLWRPDRFATRDLRTLREALNRFDDARIALGEVATGQEALTATGREALEAARIQTLIGDENRTVQFADIRLESLLYGDPERARRFVDAELRGLAEDSARAERLRETAMVWLSSGSNVTTAARLGLHEHTVRNRIGQVEELLGSPLAPRRTELLVALRLRRMLSQSTSEQE